MHSTDWARKGNMKARVELGFKWKDDGREQGWEGGAHRP